MHQSSESDIPCALFGYVSKQINKDHLSQLERQTAFHHWFAYCRTRSPEASSKERFTCPLLWCREVHNDLQSALDHVAKCPGLGAGEYWCPRCCRPERFLQDHVSHSAGQQDSVQRRTSKLRRAVVFFKNLGLRTGARTRSHDSAPRANNAFLRDFGDTYGVNSKSELESTPDSESDSSIAELHSAFVSNVQPLQELPVPLPEELSGEPIWSWGAQEQTELISSSRTVYRNSPDDYESPGYSCHSGFEAAAPPLNIPDQGHCTRTWQRQCTPLKLQIASPISSQTSIGDMNLSQLDGPSTTQFTHGAGLGYLPELAADPMEAELASNYRESTSQPHDMEYSRSASQILSVHAQFEDLRHLVKIVSDEWQQRLRVLPELHVKYPKLSPNTITVTGLQTIEGFFCGSPPETFESVFAMTHLAFACNYILHGPRDRDGWNDLVHDIAQWHLLIRDKAARTLFAKAIIQFHQAPTINECHPGRADNNTDQLWSSALPDQLAPRYPLFVAGDTVRSISIAPQPIARLEETKTLLNRLKCGTAMSVCLQWLNNPAYARLIDRSILDGDRACWYVQQHPLNIEHMKQCTTRLHQWMGLEAFSDEIVETALNVSTGRLRNPRELEITLLCCGNNSHQDMPVHNRYRKAVTEVIDDLMSNEGPDWRDRYYVAELEDVITAGLGEGELLCSTQLPTFDEAVMGGTGRFAQEGSPTDAHIISRHPAIPEVTQFAQFEPPPPYSPLGSPPDTMSPSSIAQGRPDSTSSAESLAVLPLLHVSASRLGATALCPRCRKSHTKTNLPRHIRTHDRKGLTGLIMCRERDCTETFTRRDNLDRHALEQHMGVSLRRNRVIRGRCGTPGAPLR